MLTKIWSIIVRYADWIGLGVGIFLGGICAFGFTRGLELHIGLSESSTVFVFMFVFGLFGKKLGTSLNQRSRKTE